GGGGLPEELVHLPRAAVAEEHRVAPELQAALRGKVAQPGAVVRARVAVGVLVADAGEVVVARVGVAALAVGELVGERVVVVALDTQDLVLMEERKHAIGMRAEGAQVAEAEDSIHAALPHIPQGRVEREVVVVDAAEHGDAFQMHGRVSRGLGISGSSLWEKMAACPVWNTSLSRGFRPHRSRIFHRPDALVQFPEDLVALQMVEERETHTVGDSRGAARSIKLDGWTNKLAGQRTDHLSVDQAILPSGDLP